MELRLFSILETACVWNMSIVPSRNCFHLHLCYYIVFVTHSVRKCKVDSLTNILPRSKLPCQEAETN